MKYKSLVTNYIGENCYIIFEEESKEIAVIDPGGSEDTIFKFIHEFKGKVKYIILTHSHFDHVGALFEVYSRYKASVYLNSKEHHMIMKSGSELFNVENKQAIKYEFIDEKTELSLGNVKIKCIDTPGHSPGGMCFYIDNILVTGDTLFRASVGRTDFIGGDTEALIRNIKEKLYILPEDTIVLPGHGETSTIGYEKQNNPYTL